MFILSHSKLLIKFTLLGIFLFLQLIFNISGNLETIHIKELLLNKLKKLLNNLHFKDAAVIMKKHRIDMNLFYDHNPEASYCGRP